MYVSFEQFDICWVEKLLVDIGFVYGIWVEYFYIEVRVFECVDCVVKVCQVCEYL